MKKTLLFPLALLASLFLGLSSASAASHPSHPLTNSSQESLQTFGGARIIISSGYRGSSDCNRGYRYRQHYPRQGYYYYQRPRRDYYYREYRPRPRRDYYYSRDYRYRGCR